MLTPSSGRSARGCLVAHGTSTSSREVSRDGRERTPANEVRTPGARAQRFLTQLFHKTMADSITNVGVLVAL